MKHDPYLEKEVTSWNLQCRNISKSYLQKNGVDKKVLIDINADFESGKIHLITGNTGAGKSTLIKILATIMRPSSGTLLANGQPVSRWHSSHRSIWRRKLGYMEQSPVYLEGLSVLENIALPLIPSGLALPEIRLRAIQLAQLLSINSLLEERIQNLSGGEKQRCSLARALIQNPHYLIADEPTAHQDEQEAKALLDIFKALLNRNVVIIISAHDPRLIETGFANQRYHLQAGQLTGQQIK